MAKKIIKWFTYTVLFALLPMGISFLIHVIFLSKNYYNYSKELLFFALMISSTTLGDIKNFNSKIEKDTLMTIFFSALLLLAIVSAVLYGCSIMVSLENDIKIDLYGNIFLFSVIVSIISCILATIVQIILARVEAQLNE